MQLKRFLTSLSNVSLMLTASCALAFGPKPPREVKVYVADVAKGGAYRAQNDELIVWSQTDGWMMMTAEDLQSILHRCTQPLEISRPTPIQMGVGINGPQL